MHEVANLDGSLHVDEVVISGVRPMYEGTLLQEAEFLWGKYFTYRNEIEFLRNELKTLKSGQRDPVMWLMITPEQGNKIPIYDKLEAARFAAMDNRQVIELYTHAELPK